MIELNDVRLTLSSGAGPVEILRGIDLSVAAGQAVGLVGPSGSGKSTLMAVMAGLERPDTGLVRIDGRELTAMDEDALALFRRDNIGIVFQSFHLIPAMTALENVAVPLELVGAGDAFGRAAAGLAAVGLEQRLEHYPAQLSGGEQQRVALARAMSCGPKLILADEPTGNLDGETGQAIIDLLFAMHDDRGATLILITHDPNLARRCDEVVTMADGRIAGAAAATTAAAG